MNEKSNQLNFGQDLFPSFGIHFLEDHARTIISDPKIALIELIANCWDAGANHVDIKWPTESVPDLVAIKDDGTGMTYDEFVYRWRMLNYNRKEAQGEDVVFPTDNQRSHRKAYGTNGKGRHSMFCFANRYEVETWKDGTCNIFLISRPIGLTNEPFVITPKRTSTREGHGTIISAELGKNHLSVPVVKELIGSKFVTDPGFIIHVNDELVELTDIEHFDTRHILVKNVGDIAIHCVDSQKRGRTSRQHGVAWWVNKRLVGEPGWRDFDDFAYLDARTSAAGRYTFIVEVNVLAEEVLEDWSDFRSTERVKKVKSMAKNSVMSWLQELMKDVHKSRKIATITANKNEFKHLSLESKHQIGQFIDDIQNSSFIDNKVLNATVGVLLKLEKARSGYALLEQISRLDPNDIDTLNNILESWTVREAAIVLDELGKRLNLIESLEKLVENPSVDELHELHPLFEQGLWIFGPEFESIQFMSNRNLATVLRNLIGDKEIRSKHLKMRPDLIALPDSTIGIYSSDSFDERGEVKDLSKILLVELKRGGFKITSKETRQADDYCLEIRRSGKATNAIINAYVLGTEVDESAKEQTTKGTPIHTVIQAECYSTTLHRAYARTFNLRQKIEQAKGTELKDAEIEEVLSISEEIAVFQ